jgi:Arc/MetJ-type ribon-helix-helix transcriptional regulator
LSPDQEAFIRQAIDTGRFRREEDAVEEAMLLWAEQRWRLQILTAVRKRMHPWRVVKAAESRRARK